MGVYKDKNGRWYVSVRYKNCWEGHPAKQREALSQKGMPWSGNVSFCKSIPAAWISS